MFQFWFFGSLAVCPENISAFFLYQNAPAPIQTQAAAAVTPPAAEVTHTEPTPSTEPAPSKEAAPIETQAQP